MNTDKWDNRDKYLCLSYSSVVDFKGVKSHDIGKYEEKTSA